MQTTKVQPKTGRGAIHCARANRVISWGDADACGGDAAEDNGIKTMERRHLAAIYYWWGRVRAWRCMWCDAAEDTAIKTMERRHLAAIYYWWGRARAWRCRCGCGRGDADAGAIYCTPTVFTYVLRIYVIFNQRGISDARVSARASAGSAYTGAKPLRGRHWSSAKPLREISLHCVARKTRCAGSA